MTASSKFNEMKHLVPEELHPMFESLVENVEPEPSMGDMKELANIATLLGFICSGGEIPIMMRLMPQQTITSILSPFLFAAYNIGRVRERDLGDSFE